MTKVQGPPRATGTFQPTRRQVHYVRSPRFLLCSPPLGSLAFPTRLHLFAYKLKALLTAGQTDALLPIMSKQLCWPSHYFHKHPFAHPAKLTLNSVPQSWRLASPLPSCAQMRVLEAWFPR